MGHVVIAVLMAVTNSLNQFKQYFFMPKGFEIISNLV